MQTDLSHLPEKQGEELRIITEELSKIKNTQKIILFGSFARWNYVLRDIIEEKVKKLRDMVESECKKEIKK